MSFSIIIPAYNEEKSIAIVLQQIVENIRDAEIIVVDDCSTDNTVEIIKQFERIKLIKHTTNMGPTAALMTGFQVANFDIVVSLDADGQHPVAAIPKLVEPIVRNEAEFVLGVRSTLPRLGEKIIALGAGVSDATTGFKALRKQCIPFMEGDIAYGGMLVTRVKNSNLRVKEISIDVRERIDGVSFHSNFHIFKIALKYFIWSLFIRI
ncbi:glycosyltransferase family 2 protein [Radiobacillus sp. PE A8.2]|uniref:glycosyltransferase family 2 protein n=1 Tax=Radiobacillus sp. PE A8.2 TaxID=3380349 RepID=UPI00388E0995